MVKWVLLFLILLRFCEKVVRILNGCGHLISQDSLVLKQQVVLVFAPSVNRTVFLHSEAHILACVNLNDE